MIKIISIILIFISLSYSLTYAQLWDDYDGSGGLSYNSEDVTYWVVNSGVYKAQTGGVTAPEHSYSSYDITNNIADWELSNSNNNEWIGWFDLNRTSVSGWGGSNYSCGMVLAADNSDFNSNTTQGYAIGFANSIDLLVLFKFSAGITDGTTELPGTSAQILSSGYTYSDSDNGVNFYVKLESDGKWTIKYKTGAQLSDADAINPANYSNGSVTSVSADETYRGTNYKYTGWIYAHSTGPSEETYFDNFGFAQNGSLPVELSSFSASRISNGVQLNWTTQTEVNNYGFEIERVSYSTTPLSGWEKLGFVEGHGNTNSIKHYNFVDNKIELNMYSYRLKQIDNDGSFSYSKTIQITIDAVMNYELSQNYPNPFNPVTNISFTIPDEGLVKLELYNILGQKVKSIINETKKEGFYTVSFNANELNSGIYFYRLEVNGNALTRKMNLLK